MSNKWNPTEARTAIESLERASCRSEEIFLFKFRCCQYYALAWEKDPKVADDYAKAVYRCLQRKYKNENDELVLAHYYSMCISFDDLIQADKVFKSISEFGLINDEMVWIIAVSLSEKIPFISSCLLSDNPQAREHVDYVLDKLLSNYPHDGRLNYAKAAVSYYLDETLTSAYYYARTAYTCTEPDTVGFDRVRLLLSNICGSSSVQLYRDAQGLFAYLMKDLSSESWQALGQLGIDNLFLRNEIIRHALSPVAAFEITSKTVMDKGGEDIQYSQSCAVHAINLFHLGRYDEAKQWALRAQMIFEDPRVSKCLGDIAFAIGDYLAAIQHYRSANVWLLQGQRIYERIDKSSSGERIRQACIIPRHEVIALAVAVHKKHIQAAIRLKDYAEAQLQIEVAHSHYPSGFDWSVFTDHLIDVQIAEEEHLRAQKNYNDCHHRYSELKAKVNEFARKLQVTQERFADNDLDEPENWDGFFSELGNIVNKMVEEAKHSDENRRLFKDIDDSFRKAYPWLVEDAIGSLITAEFLFQVHADGSFIDYAPIVVGFAKSIEVQIKYVKGLSNDDKTTLGQLISMVRNQEDDSINERLGSINILRCKAAHVAVLNREDAEKMRRMLYGIKGRKTKGLLLLFAD